MIIFGTWTLRVMAKQGNPSGALNMDEGPLEEGSLLVPNVFWDL